MIFIDNIFRRKRRGTSPKAKESREGYVTEISEKLLARSKDKEAEEYEANRDYDKRRAMMLELMETEDAMNNLYIFHLKFLIDWTLIDFLDVLISVWNDFGLMNYSTHTQQTLSAITLMNKIEEYPQIHAGDEMLIVVNEPNHELKVYVKDNYLKIGMDGSSKHVSQRNKQKQALNYHKYLAHIENQPFKEILAIKTDLLNECFKVFFLQNSRICKITTPQQTEITDDNERFKQILKKYSL